MYMCNEHTYMFMYMYMLHVCSQICCININYIYEYSQVKLEQTRPLTRESRQTRALTRESRQTGALTGESRQTGALTGESRQTGAVEVVVEVVTDATVETAQLLAVVQLHPAVGAQVFPACNTHTDK